MRYTVENARNETNDEILRWRVDRQREVRLCTQAIKSRQNVFIHGERGVGKTFLLRTLNFELLGTGTEFPVLYSVWPQSPKVVAYPELLRRCLLVQMLISAWRNLLGLRYTELRLSAALHEKATARETSLEDTLSRLYQVAAAQSFSSSRERQRNVGFDTLVKGQITESAAEELAAEPLLGLEFAELVREFSREVLEPLGRNGVVFLCDEANILPEDQQSLLVSSLREEFLAHEACFVFVAGCLPESVGIHIPETFEVILQLEGLERNDLQELIINRFATSGCCFSEDAVAAICNFSKGNPRCAIAVCCEALSAATEDSSKAVKVDENLMRAACERYMARRVNLLKSDSKKGGEGSA